MNLERHILGLDHERLFLIYAFFDVTFPSGLYGFSFCIFLLLYFVWWNSDTCCSLVEELELSFQFLAG